MRNEFLRPVHGVSSVRRGVSAAGGPAILNRKLKLDRDSGASLGELPCWVSSVCVCVCVDIREALRDNDAQRASSCIRTMPRVAVAAICSGRRNNRRA